MSPRVSKFQICVLMFLHAYAIGTYLVPLPNVLAAHGLGDYVKYPFIIASLVSFVSPMIVGSLADKRYAPERLLAVVTAGGAVLISLTYLAVHQRWGPGAYLALAACYHFWASPGWGLLTSIGLMHLERPEVEFAPLRVWATIGFMCGAFAVSQLFDADQSAVTGWIAGGIFLLEAAFCLTLPPSHPAASAHPKRMRDYLGWDAIKLFRQRDHRMIFLTTALYSIPLAAFYPYTPQHLHALGVEKTSRLMALAQFSEVLCMYALAALMMRFRLKWLVQAGVLFGVARFGLFATDWLPALALGIALHGLIYVLFSMTTQIYMEKRLDGAIRNQAQALLLVMANGVGSLSGYLLCDWWHDVCSRPGGVMHWPQFWLPLACGALAVAVVFQVGYRGHAATRRACDGEDGKPES